MGRPAPLVEHLDERLVQATLSDVLVPPPGEANRIEGEEHALKDEDAQYWDRFSRPNQKTTMSMKGLARKKSLALTLKRKWKGPKGD